jgi:hypothetical protein
LPIPEVRTSVRRLDQVVEETRHEKMVAVSGQLSAISETLSLTADR